MNTTENIIPINGNQRMSINKSSWAWSTHVGAASVKSVLVAMAECANSKTLMAFPSIAHLCEMTELNRKTIISSLSALVSMGLIEDTGSKTGATLQIVVYRLLVGNSPKSGTVKSYGNSARSGTVPETEQYQNVAETVPLLRETVPLLRGNSTRSGTRIPEGSLSIPEGSLIERGGTLKNQQQDEHREVSAKPPPAQRKATNLPADWSLPDDYLQWALTERTDWTDSHAKLTAQIFADYWHGKGGKDARKADWFATWRNWVRRENSLTSKPKPTQPKRDRFDMDDTTWIQGCDPERLGFTSEQWGKS